MRPRGAVAALERNADPSGGTRQSRPSAPPFATSPGKASMSCVSIWPAPPIRVGWRRMASAIRRRRRALERVKRGHPLEREREGEDAAAVEGEGIASGVELDGLGERRQDRLLDRVLRRPVALAAASRARGRGRASRRACRSSCGGAAGQAPSCEPHSSSSSPAGAAARSDAHGLELLGLARCEAQAIASSRSSRSGRARAAAPGTASRRSASRGNESVSPAGDDAFLRRGPRPHGQGARDSTISPRLTATLRGSARSWR